MNPGDLVIHLGDVYFGPAGGWEDLIFNLPGRKILVRGNHDDNFLCDPEVDLDADDVRYLYELPMSLILKWCGKRILVCHSKPENNMVPCREDELNMHLDSFRPFEPDWVVIGHTHMVFDRCYEGIRFINCGHLGRDLLGDPFYSWWVARNGILNSRQRGSIGQG